RINKLKLCLCFVSEFQLEVIQHTLSTCSIQHGVFTTHYSSTRRIQYELFNTQCSTRRIQRYSPNSYSTNFICNSSNCFASMVEGASIMTSLPLLFLGKAITSRMDSLPPSKAQSLSNPHAIPPCGGAPYSKAPKR